jgi:hypothetical protein
MNPRRCIIFFVVALGLLLAGPRAFCQSLRGTTLGQSQNDDRDLANSLIVNKRQKVGKGEKKEEVDPKKLTSKKSNDTTFSGSMNDIGLDWRSKTMGKPHVTNEKEPEPAKTESNVDRDLKAAKTSDAASATKEQGAASSKSDEKAKPSASKADGDH